MDASYRSRFHPLDATHEVRKPAFTADDLALIVLGWEPDIFTLQNYRDTFPEGALRQSLRAIAARLGNPAPSTPEVAT